MGKEIVTMKYGGSKSIDSFINDIIKKCKNIKIYFGYFILFIYILDISGVKKNCRFAMNR